MIVKPRVVSVAKYKIGNNWNVVTCLINEKGDPYLSLLKKLTYHQACDLTKRLNEERKFAEAAECQSPKD